MKKKGAALIITLVFVAVLLIVGGAVAQIVTSTSITNARMENLDYLRLTAETGIERGYAYLKKNYSIFLPSAYTAPYNMPEFSIEGSKYKCRVTIYNYDTNNTSNYGMYTIVATASSGSSTKTVTANVSKGFTTSVTTTPFADIFDKFYAKLITNSAAIVNPVVSNSGQKDAFTNSGNISILFKENTYFQGKINPNTFKPGNGVTILDPSNTPEVVTYPTTVETIQMPTFLADSTYPYYVPQRDVIIKHDPAYDSSMTDKILIQYTTGTDINSVIKSTINGYTVVLINGNLTIEGSVTLNNYILYSNGTTDNLGTVTINNSSSSKDAEVHFVGSTFSGKTLVLGKKTSIYFDSAPNITDTATNTAIKSYIYQYLSTTPLTTEVVTMVSNPGSILRYQD